ncbi:nucleotidyltransferase domain-containing protein [Brucella grignonensis]|uniref:Putative nucleotidyltransferase family protein n=1 Tax=Brucella grignonensis TaxID=94627 RepID=A0A256FAT7_9HYPH|nr:nucleotidyltransferase domain-containing protein [Brucella grignonensis]NKB83289.1 nucleotidyltransferase domain-containing protein [Brucella grignonensis]OYR11893.1 putative nucleotidyltransferase family protein [Brucella grignonensis]
MRSLPENFDPEAVIEIDRRLAAVESDEKAVVALAIESGSRAWGFPSPDSDYDCRFVFVRSFDETLTLFPRRDVIETPLTPIIDVNGWELSKALKLMLAGNAVIVEWLTSPIVYKVNPDFRTAFLSLANDVCDRNGIARHYFYLARNQFERSIGDGQGVAIKKVFYALRPLMALKWLRLHPRERIAPMHFPTLCRAVDLSNDLSVELESLMQRKAETREMGQGNVSDVIMTFLKKELSSAENNLTQQSKVDDDVMENRERADAFWRHWLNALYCDRNALR